ncbi:MAG: hypothetical protein HOC74_28100 [Gemmatimonadetes bacterium]|jgi:hypothetical protein|nr:hypothetical protein [Gemmatimonadota bacterium]
MENATFAFALFGLFGLGFALVSYLRVQKLRRRIAGLERQVFGTEKTSADYPDEEAKDGDEESY